MATKAKLVPAQAGIITNHRVDVLPSARSLFYQYACGVLTVCFLVAASGSTSPQTTNHGLHTLSMSLGLPTTKFFAKKSAPKNLFMQNKPNFLDTKNERIFC